MADGVPPELMTGSLSKGKGGYTFLYFHLISFLQVEAGRIFFFFSFFFFLFCKVTQFFFMLVAQFFAKMNDFIFSYFKLLKS